MASSGTARMISSTSSRMRLRLGEGPADVDQRAEPLAPAGVAAGDRVDRPAGPRQRDAERGPDRAGPDDPDDRRLARLRVVVRVGVVARVGLVAVAVEARAATGSRSMPAASMAASVSARSRSGSSPGRSPQAFIGAVRGHRPGSSRLHPSSVASGRGRRPVRYTGANSTRGGRTRPAPTDPAHQARSMKEARHDVPTTDPRSLRRARAAARRRLPRRYYRLDAVADRIDLGRPPVTVKILLENLLRHAGGGVVRAEDVETLLAWRPGLGRPRPRSRSCPSRVLLQDFTGVPAVVDLAVMRDAMADLGGDPARVNPLVPADLVIDHSVQVDRFGTPGAFAFNVEREYDRNGERYQLLRWAQTAFRDLRVVPPGTGIVHQVNLEFLATGRRPTATDGDGGRVAFPDTLVGTDSHTTMVNGLGVLGYGVGGIEAEAVLLGQPLYQPMPHVVGVRLHGALPRGSTATDLVLVVTEMLRAHGVVGSFVEFAGDGLASLSLADRATISNMSPEFGATSTLFPIDDETLAYLRLTGRSAERVDARRALRQGPGPVARARRRARPSTSCSSSTWPASSRPWPGPRRPQDRVPLDDLRDNFRTNFPNGLEARSADLRREAPVPGDGASRTPRPTRSRPRTRRRSRPATPTASRAAGRPGRRRRAAGRSAAPTGRSRSRSAARPSTIRTGSVAIAAITSCTNTSNPTVMVGAGLLARNAVARGLRVGPDGQDLAGARARGP